MYVKLLNPRTNGRMVYANAGSARRATNYLAQEAKEQGQAATFFGAAARGDLSADAVGELLDANHQGLGKEAAKFYSLVLSPSAEEVAALGNSPDALRQYTRDVMELYAQNFKLAGGNVLHEPDLVWAATLHQERKNRGTDAGAQGDYKPGLQTHVHVLVSARDAAQKRTLNPLGKAERFNRVAFQAQAGVQLEEQLGRAAPREIGGLPPTREQRTNEKARDIQAQAARTKEKKPLTAEQLAAKDARLEIQVARVNTKWSPTSQLDPTQVKAAAKERGYDNIFYDRLGKIERGAEQGKFTPEPYAYLRTGLVQRVELVEIPSQRSPFAPPVRPVREERASPVFQHLERSMNQLARAIAPKARTQDVRSEEERLRDRQRDQEVER